MPGNSSRRPTSRARVGLQANSVVVAGRRLRREKEYNHIGSGWPYAGNMTRAADESGEFGAGRAIDLQLHSSQAPRLNAEQEIDMQSEAAADIHLSGIGQVDLHPPPLMALLVEDNPADAERISLVLQPGPLGAGLMPVRLIQRGDVACVSRA